MIRHAASFDSRADDAPVLPGRQIVAGATRRTAPGDTRSPHVGAVLDSRYCLQDLLGSGATADVYRARDCQLARAVAIKLFRRRRVDPHLLTRARTEARLGALLNHPAVVRVLDASGLDGTDHEVPRYLVLELVNGPNLAQQLRCARLTAPHVVRLGAYIAGALAYLHRLRIVHHDVKPANIVLAPAHGTDEPAPVKLIDLGTARLIEPSANVIGPSTNAGPGYIVGTPNYVSPENVRGEQAGPPGDVYSLGLVLLEALTGRRAFPGTSIDAVIARLHQTPTVPGWLDGKWSALLRAMTARSPCLRPTASEVGAALQAMCG